MFINGAKALNRAAKVAFSDGYLKQGLFHWFHCPFLQYGFNKLHTYQIKILQASRITDHSASVSFFDFRADVGKHPHLQDLVSDAVCQRL